MKTEDLQPLLDNKDGRNAKGASFGLGASTKCKETLIILVILSVNMLGLIVDMMPITFFTYEAKKRGLAEYQTGIVLGCYDFGRLISGPLCASVVSFAVSIFVVSQGLQSLETDKSGK